MQLINVSASSAVLPQLTALYERAFPANERWGMDAVLRDDTGVSELLGFFDGDRFLGFAVLLKWEDIVHIVYFAVMEELRSRGVGSEALRMIRARYPGRRIVVDIEREHPGADNNEQRRRRKLFYMRSGYAESHVYYRWHGERYETLILGGTIRSREYYRFWHRVAKNSRIFKKE